MVSYIHLVFALYLTLAGAANITYLLEQEWIPQRPSKIGVPRDIYGGASPSYKARIEWLSAVAKLAKIGYDFRISGSNGEGVFSLSPETESARTPRIPSVIHQTWKSKDVRSHSADAVECTDILRKHASDYYYVLWTDHEIMDFIKDSYPDYFQYYLKLNMNIKRADLARYLILHKFGGVYVDLDVELKRNLGDLVRVPAMPSFISYRSKEFEKHREPFAGNAFFGCAPSSLIMHAVVRHAMSYSNPLVKDVYGVLRHTGPMGLGLVVQRVLANPSDFPNEVVLIYNSSVVGNIEDDPWAAVHRRKHRWWGH